MVTDRTDYTALAVEAARAVLLEVHRVLGEYLDRIVLVGGWVPQLLLPEDHIGSTDVDLALDHRKLTEIGYKGIKRLLQEAGYNVSDKQPFIFWRDVTIAGRTIKVELDLLAGEYLGSSRGHRTQKIQDAHARKARGCDLAFMDPVNVRMEGVLPCGGRDTIEIRVASITTFLVMKGMALHDRLKAKDAWDIDYCLRRYPGGPDALADMLKPCMGNPLIREGLGKIAAKFLSPMHIGPVQVAYFDGLTDPEEREITQRASFERVLHLMKSLEVDPWTG